MIGMIVILKINHCLTFAWITIFKVSSFVLNLMNIMLAFQSFLEIRQAKSLKLVHTSTGKYDGTCRCGSPLGLLQANLAFLIIKGACHLLGFSPCRL